MRRIEYFYSAHSAFAYLGSARLMELCRVHDCQLEHRPIDLRPVIHGVGGLPVNGRTRAHVDYFFGREIERWAEWREVDIIDYRPTHHDNSLDLPNGMLIAAAQQGANVDALAHAVLQAHWRDDADLADAPTLAAVASKIDIDAAPLLEAALSAPVQQQHQANTQEAIERSVFGSPTYVLDGDMFYGQDHLEMLERALKQPFTPSRFRNP